MRCQHSQKWRSNGARYNNLNGSPNQYFLDCNFKREISVQQLLGLRDCCRSIRIGKILVESDSDTHEAHVVYARFPEDIQFRKVLLMYPILSTGNTVIKAVNVLKEHLVQEDNIILANLFCTPSSIRSVLTAFPSVSSVEKTCFRII